MIITRDELYTNTQWSDMWQVTVYAWYTRQSVALPAPSLPPTPDTAGTQCVIQTVVDINTDLLFSLVDKISHMPRTKNESETGCV